MVAPSLFLNILLCYYMNDAFSLIININNEPFAFFSAYIQEIGRCGRDGLPSTTTHYFTIGRM